jgi:biofilm PGA synthesis N-glycosyltransferase PgaC
MGKRNRLSYVLITPAHNEEAFIEKTLSSVIGQTILPIKWVIVSDGSTDRTDEIVKEKKMGRDWIELIRMPKRNTRHFAGKANAFNAGYRKVQSMEFELIANLDADVSFGEDYFVYLIERFEEFPELGVGGTLWDGGYDAVDESSFYNEKDVVGCCQVFRRKCFDMIGGYVPIKQGGVDWIAVRTARMKGWKTMSFSGRRFYHHRPMGTAGGNLWSAKFQYGRKDYYLGNHPVWEGFRVIYQMTQKPFIVGGLLVMTGYVWDLLKRTNRPISKELIEFHRREEMDRLKGFIGKLRKVKVDSKSHVVRI